ncbi:cysteine--tRNA ligase [Candidatus Peregrinibacteria bacterium CG_4_10_14_0_2_um_filter_43_11]|nr:MAG: cysteine--tRNA ligase [Candidatus Peregrinibacteria bacterium CG_4_10_14_0_2_um_filter_43_11]
MKIYNTLTRQKEELKPIHDKKVGLYCCGPTVYNYAHIGNLRSFLFEDFLRRTLEFNDYDVNQVMNITDVGHLTSDSDEGEDKMEKGAKREGKTVWEIAEHYTTAFFDDIDALNIKRATHYPKATDHIEEMIRLVQRIEANGYTYQAGGNVYFDTGKMEDYGKLTGGTVETRHSASPEHTRIDVDPNKKHPHDFVLWFTESKHGNQDMQWESPWGKGFPGWHLECSAMSMKYLGKQFDIHCGGIDHVPVHHTNEIAQTEAATGKKPWVKYWMHGEFLLVGSGGKMAKSGDNFVILQTLRDRGFDALDYRYFCMQAHYRKELKFSWEGLEAAKTARRRLHDRANVGTCHDTSGKDAINRVSGDYMQKFNTAINDDLNIPQSLSITWELVDDTSVPNEEKMATLSKFDEVLGLKLGEKEVHDTPKEIEELIEQRDTARLKKDWATSDTLRKEIEDAGWIVEDKNDGGTIVKPK